MRSENEKEATCCSQVANPSDRLFSVLEQARALIVGADGVTPLATLVKKPGDNILRVPEGRLLLRTLAESLNINRYSFQEDFLARYTPDLLPAQRSKS